MVDIFQNDNVLEYSKCADKKTVRMYTKNIHGYLNYKTFWLRIPVFNKMISQIIQYITTLLTSRFNLIYFNATLDLILCNHKLI